MHVKNTTHAGKTKPHNIQVQVHVISKYTVVRPHKKIGAVLKKALLSEKSTQQRVNLTFPTSSQKGQAALSESSPHGGSIHIPAKTLSATQANRKSHYW